MEKLGEKLPPEIFTFSYSGREPKSVDSFLRTRPDVKNLYIYDLLLSTGKLLYSCKGGIGVTKEPYIVDMHKFIKLPNCVSILKEVYHEKYKGNFTRGSYQRSREVFNEKTKKITNWKSCAELYALWAASGFTHRYKLRGYEGTYLPSKFRLDQLQEASRTSREKNLLFDRRDFFSFSESIINENVVIYMHLPQAYGVYGAGFLWNEKVLKNTKNIIDELSILGYKICVSALHVNRGRLLIDYSDLLPSLNNVYVEQFKVSELGSECYNSDIYLLNF